MPVRVSPAASVHSLTPPRSAARLVVAAALAACVGAAALAPAAHADDPPEEPDRAEVALGERLFLETRFAQFFAANSAADVNAPLAEGDPAVALSVTPDGALPGPFAGASMNCRSCHLVDEHAESVGGGVRTYGDFAPRSPIPARADGLAVTLRNSPPLVNSALPRAKKSFFLHFDGEFTTTQALVEATLTGRNYGWLASEHDAAVAHVARVVREDDGTGDLAQEFGGAYAKVLAGRDPSIPAELRLPRKYRIDVTRANDTRVFRAVARLIAVYVDQLRFGRGDDGAYEGSAYDLFLARNALPRAPHRREAPAKYAARLLGALDALESPLFVTPADGTLAFHDHEFRFGPDELAGLRTFLTRPSDAPAAATSGVGNCVACHTPPDFTDFAFHDTGASQLEYDALHGGGAFAALAIPTYEERKRDFDAFLPPTPRHPDAAGPFAAVPDVTRPGHVDLGAWNVLGNPDHRAASSRLARHFRARFRDARSNAALLEHAVATFKTPTLRDLGQSGPYLHDARVATLEGIVAFYRGVADMQRAGTLRNGDDELAGVRLAPEDDAPLAAFLRALDEDYD